MNWSQKDLDNLAKKGLTWKEQIKIQEPEIKPVTKLKAIKFSEEKFHISCELEHLVKTGRISGFETEYKFDKVRRFRFDWAIMAYNNHVIKFKSDLEDSPALNCHITGLGINAVLYPLPSGEFFFNFKEYIMAVINTKNFEDDLVTDLTSNDADTFTYDVTDGTYRAGNVLITINFADASFDSITRTLHFIAGVEQLETYQKNETLISESNYAVLSPVKDNTNNTNYLKYWAGYPFEFSFHTINPEDPFGLLNQTTGIEHEFEAKGPITSMWFSDGRTDVTIEDFIPITTGMNIMRIKHNDELQDPVLNIEKVDAECGVYIKFLNKYGRWNYWLFSQYHFRTRGSKYIAEINNDFNNIEDTKSPVIQIGKTSADYLRCAAERLYNNEKTLLSGITDSPKIYLFTGERFSRSNHKDWVEISMKTGSFSLLEPKKKIYSFYIEFDLPNRYTQKL